MSDFANILQQADDLLNTDGINISLNKNVASQSQAQFSVVGKFRVPISLQEEVNSHPYNLICITLINPISKVNLSEYVFKNSVVLSDDFNINEDSVLGSFSFNIFDFFPSINYEQHYIFASMVNYGSNILSLSRNSLAN